jgi:thiol-disulfide isomerase/thioredoxin
MRWAWRLLFVVLWSFILIRLAPHVGAVLGIETRDDVSPEYAFTTLDGTVITHDSLRGQVVLVNVWATWCAPCRVEMPALQAMANRHRTAGLTVLGLSRDHADASVVEAFLYERGITYPVAVVPRNAETLFGGVRGYPTSFLIDRSGNIRYRALGPLAMVSFEPAVRRLLSESMPP